MKKVAHILICPRGVMDNTSDSGSEAGGSIPSEGAFFLKIIIDQHEVKIIFLFHFSTVYF